MSGAFATRLVELRACAARVSFALRRDHPGAVAAASPSTRPLRPRDPTADHTDWIAKLLSADWFSAVDRCQSLLDATTGTLRELNEILLRDTHHFVALREDLSRRSAFGAEGSNGERPGPRSGDAAHKRRGRKVASSM